MTAYDYESLRASVLTSIKAHMIEFRRIADRPPGIEVALRVEGTHLLDQIMPPCNCGAPAGEADDQHDPGCPTRAEEMRRLGIHVERYR